MNNLKLTISLCMNALFADNDWDANAAEIAERGFKYMECWQLPVAKKQILPSLLSRYGLTLTAFCPDCFELTTPAMRDAYISSIQEASDFAMANKCHSLITQVGEDTGKPRTFQHESVVLGLKAVVPILRNANITLLIEPLNVVKNHPNYYLYSSREAFDIVREVDSPYVKVLYDVYHQLHTGEDVLSDIRSYSQYIGHFHIAGYPNRDEDILTGFDYRPFFDLVRKMNLTCPIGIELFPPNADARERLYRLLKTL